MREFGEDYKKDVQINKFKLEDECQSHPSLCAYYTDVLADAKKRKSTIADELSLLTAQVEMDIRENPPEGMKVTDKAISALLDSNDKIVAKKKELVKAKYDVDVYEGAIKSIEHRKSMLNDLVDLYISGYYSKPQASVQNRNDVTEQTSDGVRKNLNRRKKLNEE